MNKTKTLIALGILALYVIGIVAITIPMTSAIIVDADYITIYAGEEGKVSINVENNENFDIEGVSVQIVLGTVSPTGEFVSLPFSVIGSSEKDLDDLNEDDDDSITFTIKASTDIKPGDYNIPYVIKYTNIDEDKKETKNGSFGFRVSARTDLDFGVDVKEQTKKQQLSDNKGKLL